MMDKNDKKRFSVTLTTAYVKGLNHLIKKGIYVEKQDAIRHALRHLFQHHGIKPFALKKVKLDKGS